MSEAEVRADERRKIADEIWAEYNAHPDDPALSRSWVAGWRSAVNHLTTKIRKGL